MNLQITETSSLIQLTSSDCLNFGDSYLVVVSGDNPIVMVVTFSSICQVTFDAEEFALLQSRILWNS